MFAQLFSQGVYGGRVELNPDKLCEMDTVNQEDIPVADMKQKSLERLRDADIPTSAGRFQKRRKKIKN